jgi:outer membrane lipoprotein-sorting protein
MPNNTRYTSRLQSTYRAATLVLAFAGLTGCAARQLPPPMTAAQPDLEASSLADREALLTSLQTPAIMQYSGPSGHIKAREQLTARRPASLRVEAMSPLGVAMIVAADGDQIAVFDPSNNTLIRGDATAATLAHFTQIPMAPEQAVRLLLGLAPDNSITAVVSSSPWFEGEMKVLSYSSQSGAHYELGFRGGQLALVRKRETDGRIAYEVQYSDYRDIGAIKFPYEIQARFFTSSTSIKLRYLEPLIDRQIADSTFVLSPGPATRLIELGLASPSA